MTVVTPPEGPRYPMPFTRTEIAVLGRLDGQLQVLLVRRAQAPQAGRWALPGGVLRIDLDPSLEDAAQRVVHERLGLRLPFLRQLLAVGGPTRDERAPWALSVVYRALVEPSALPAVPGKRIAALAWRPVDDLAADRTIAFDHAALVAQAVAATREEVERLQLPAGYLPEAFTLGELQMICEELLGRPLDKSSFRRKLADRALVQPIEGALRGGANRPAQLFRLAP
jgi:ADP-ribose pyrophosphatase YjhB (NUDIX family)